MQQQSCLWKSSIRAVNYTTKKRSKLGKNLFYLINCDKRQRIFYSVYLVLRYSISDIHARACRDNKRSVIFDDNLTVWGRFIPFALMLKVSVSDFGQICCPVVALTKNIFTSYSSFYFNAICQLGPQFPFIVHHLIVIKLKFKS